MVDLGRYVQFTKGKFCAILRPSFLGKSSPMKSRFLYIILILILFTTFKGVQASEDVLICADCHSALDNSLNHSDLSCSDCHRGYTGFPHENTIKGNCLNCHSRHPEKTAHDTHINVTCEACHLDGIVPAIIQENNKTVWEYNSVNKGEFDPHNFVVPGEEVCGRCHFKGNSLGASSRKLPAKSIICMACHASTFSVSDPLSIAALIIFLIGISGTAAIWISAGSSYRNKAHSGSSRVMRIINALIIDVIFQRKLYKASALRWFIHAIILFPLLARFIWGLAALITSLAFPEVNSAWILLDKNDPATAFFFDFTGLLILSGGFLMLLQKIVNKRKNRIKGLPQTGAWIHALAGAIVITGFVAEGARISMTGFPDGSHYAFIGFLISRVFNGIQLDSIYVYLWYLHALMAAAFIGALPFSRMFHILTAPVSMLLKGASGED